MLVYTTSTMTNSIENLQVHDLVCITLDIHLWSGRQALKRDALIASNPSLAGLPPEGLASMGSVRICDPDEVRKFARLKAEAHRILELEGLPFLGSVAVTVDKFDEVAKKLDIIKAKFRTMALDLLNRYDAQAKNWKDRWCKENPAHAHLLRRMPTAEQVVGKLSFNYHPYRVSAPTDESGTAANSLFTEQLHGLKGELLTSIGIEATDLLKKYLVDTDTGQRRDKITQKTLRPLKRITAKLHDFSFVDQTVKPLADLIDHVLTQTPSDGPITGTSLLMIFNLANMLSNPAAAARIASAAMEQGPEAVVDEFEFIAGRVSAAVAKDSAAMPSDLPVILGSSSGNHPSTELPLIIDQLTELASTDVIPAIQVAQVESDFVLDFI